MFFVFSSLSLPFLSFFVLSGGGLEKAKAKEKGVRVRVRVRLKKRRPKKKDEGPLDRR